MMGGRCCGFSDESKQNLGRFRSVALVTLSESRVESIRGEVAKLLLESGVRELKWTKLNGGRDRHAVQKVLRFVFDSAVRGELRVDVVVWDCHDSRHSVARRDDVGNLERMHYHLYCCVFRDRWPRQTTWMLHPDENTGVNWDGLAEFVANAAFRTEIPPPLAPSSNPRLIVCQDYSVEDIRPKQSHKEPLIQIADVFAGIGNFSHESYHRYALWLSEETQKAGLFNQTAPASEFSRSERERFAVLHDFDQTCKANKMGVSLKTYRGLRTMNPKTPINFWSYCPQTDADKAPTKPSAKSTHV
jgi:hypothetical protein